MTERPKKAKTLLGAYAKGISALVVMALGVVGAVFAWRLANKLADKVLEEGQTGANRPRGG